MPLCVSKNDLLVNESCEQIDNEQYNNHDVNRNQKQTQRAEFRVGLECIDYLDVAYCHRLSISSITGKAGKAFSGAEHRKTSPLVYQGDERPKSYIHTRAQLGFSFK
jgi:hypothetical protein